MEVNRIVSVFAGAVVMGSPGLAHSAMTVTRQARTVNPPADFYKESAA